MGRLTDWALQHGVAQFEEETEKSTLDVLDEDA